MSDVSLFIIAMVCVVVMWGSITLKDIDKKEFFSTKEGKGILKGIILAMLFAIGFALIPNCSQASTWFNEAEVFAGLEATKKVNPMCVEGSTDHKTGSNLGLKLNVYRSDRFSLNSKYTHHSCAFGSDDKSYDALGFELEYKFWSR